ncbi:hypothetical protein DdX_20888 [Ditylenchus destructor]|uniref:Uncharacterized protein n=1 Tax=Ditylenchus destructor TaxID=166010 RepID=A0AAD4QRM7_9BILA|nr:hypothetical protein DdX_20888 [Ditylenchus destructor]
MAFRNNPNSDNFSQLFFVNSYKQLALIKHFLVHAIKETAAEKLYDVKESNKGKPIRWTAFGRFVTLGRQGRTLPHYRNSQQILQGASQKVKQSTSPQRDQWGPLLKTAGVTPAKPKNLAPTFSLDRGSVEKKRRRKRGDPKVTEKKRSTNGQGTATANAASKTQEEDREKEAIREVRGELNEFAKVFLQNPLLTPDDIKYAHEMAQAYEAVTTDVNEFSEAMTLEQVKFNPEFREVCTQKQLTDHNKLLEKAREALKEDPVADSPKLGTVEMSEFAKVLNADKMSIPFVEEAQEKDGELKALAKSLMAGKAALKQVKPEDDEEKKVKAMETFISALVKYSEKIGDKAPPMEKVSGAPTKSAKSAAAKRPAATEAGKTPRTTEKKSNLQGGKKSGL